MASSGHQNRTCALSVLLVDRLEPADGKRVWGKHEQAFSVDRFSLGPNPGNMPCPVMKECVIGSPMTMSGYSSAW